MQRTPRIHVFHNMTSGDVYDYTQTHDQIKNGDVLVVVDELITGVMIEAWPTSVDSDHHGQFHTMDLEVDWSNIELLVSDYHSGATHWNYNPAIEMAKAVRIVG